MNYQQPNAGGPHYGYQSQTAHGHPQQQPAQKVPQQQQQQQQQQHQQYAQQPAYAQEPVSYAYQVPQSTQIAGQNQPIYYGQYQYYYDNGTPGQSSQQVAAPGLDPQRAAQSGASQDFVYAPYQQYYGYRPPVMNSGPQALSHQQQMQQRAHVEGPALHGGAGMQAAPGQHDDYYMMMQQRGGPTGPIPPQQLTVTDPSGQTEPPGSKPKVTTTLWEDENTLCFQIEARGICVARREDNNYINGTKLLNVAGMTRGRRDGLLKGERERHVVKAGAMHLKGVWIPYQRALEFANKEKIVDLLYPLFVTDIKSVLYNPKDGSSIPDAGTQLAQHHPHQHHQHSLAQDQGVASGVGNGLPQLRSAKQDLGASGLASGLPSSSSLVQSTGTEKRAEGQPTIAPPGFSPHGPGSQGQQQLAGAPNSQGAVAGIPSKEFYGGQSQNYTAHGQPPQYRDGFGGSGNPSYQV